MMQIIRQLCQKAGCQPKDLVVEWTPTTGARVTGTNAKGEKTSVNVLCRLEHIAHAIYLCVNGQEHLYPRVQKQQAALDAKVKEWLADDEDQAQPQTQWEPAPNTRENLLRDWRHLDSVPEILRVFPLHPSPDDVIDLYQRNKKLNSPHLKALLEKHSQSTVRRS